MSKDAPKPVEPRFAPSGFFALRTPLLSFDALLAWSEGLRAPGAADDALGDALAADRALLRQRLRAQLEDPVVREAIFVASPSLFDSLDEWRSAPDSERGLKVERSLVRYFQRMGARPTPFGLFAGCTTGTLTATTRLELDGRAGHRRHTRLDMDYLFALAGKLDADASLRRRLRYRPSSGIYRAAGQLRYAESRLVEQARSYHLVAVESSDYLDETLARAEHGLRLDELAAPLAAGEITRAEADEFIAELVDTQLLVSELAPPVTGPQPMGELVAQLRALAAAETQSAGELSLAADAAARLGDAHDALARLDAAGLGAAPDGYRAIAATLESLPAKVELSRLFQVDLVKPSPVTLGPEVPAELTRVITLLTQLAPPQPDALQPFREDFARRYETREVRLVDVLDEELGIGFNSVQTAAAEPSPLLQGIALPPPPPSSSVPGGARQAVLLTRLSALLRAGEHELVLDDDDVKALRSTEPRRLPGAFFAMATVLAPSSAAVAEGRFTLYFNGANGPSGANMLGRFCHADPALDSAVRAHLAAEEALDPDAIFAEIAHLPEGRIGNILLRPTLRGHEIAYLGRSGLPREQQLDVGDLWVSLVAGEVVLRSRRLGRRIIPRLSTAHNFSLRALGLYRFLCSLQMQHCSGVGWSWMGLDAAPFLPRVRSGRTILSRARWQLPKATVQKLGSAGPALFAAARALRRELGLPRFVALEDGDNELPVDFDNVLSLESFAQLVKDRAGARLVELLAGDDELCAHGPDGRFTHELIVPFVQLPATPPARKTAPAATVNVTRSFAPGSSWLYAKVYTGAAAADSVLREVVSPLVRATVASGAVRRWFFVRYGDPDWHLRLRFEGEPARLFGEVLPSLHQLLEPLLADRRAWRLQLDTYEREVERYGGDDGIVLAERLFHADSEAVLAIVDGLSGDDAADARWQLALAGMDLLLDDLGFALDAKRTLMSGIRDGYFAEHRMEGAWAKPIGARFRKERAALEQLLDGNSDAEHWLAPGLGALRERSPAVRAIARELTAAHDRLGCTRDELAASFLHMHANRLLRSSQRAHEMVLYDFLDRLYESQQARAKKAR